MGFFEIFKGKVNLGGNGDVDLGAYAHKRYHARYIINDRDLCTIEHAKHGVFRVVDLSHHGCLVESISESSFDGCALPALIDLSVCGSAVRLEISGCQRRKNGWGLVFRHAHETSIRNLNEFIEPLRCGSSVSLVPGSDERQMVVNRTRRRFQGEGPFAMVFERNEKGVPIFFMITTHQGSSDVSVIWENGRLLTKKASDMEGARMPQTPDLDLGITWISAVTCLGIKYAEGAFCAKILFDAIAGSMRPKLAKSS